MGGDRWDCILPGLKASSGKTNLYAQPDLILCLGSTARGGQQQPPRTRPLWPIPRSGRSTTNPAFSQGTNSWRPQTRPRTARQTSPLRSAFGGAPLSSGGGEGEVGRGGIQRPSEAQGTRSPSPCVLAGARAPRPPRCSYVLVFAVAPRLVLEPRSATRAAAAAAALPGPRRGRLGRQGLGPRALILGALAAQQAAGLRGRREGPRGVDLAREPLVQRSHGSPRSLAACRALRYLFRFLPLGSRSHPSLGKRGREASSCGLPRAPVRPRRPPAQPPRPLPGAAGEAGSGGVFSFCFLFCFFNSSPRPRRASSKPPRAGKYKTREREGTAWAPVGTT